MSESIRPKGVVRCARLGKELEGLDRPPFPGELGREIFERVSAAAWQEWTEQEVLIINHYTLNLIDPAHHDFLMEKMRAYLLEGAPGVDTSVAPDDRPEHLS